MVGSGTAGGEDRQRLQQPRRYRPRAGRQRGDRGPGRRAPGLPTHSTWPHPAAGSVDLLVITPTAATDGTNNDQSADHLPLHPAAGPPTDATHPRAWQWWVRLLAARGILAAVLPPTRSPQQPAAVVAAAVGAGLAYLQHIPVVLWSVDDAHLDPPLSPDAGVFSQLWRPVEDVPMPELLPAHADVLLFTAPAVLTDADPAHWYPSSDRSANQATGGNR